MHSILFPHSVFLLLKEKEKGDKLSHGMNLWVNGRHKDISRLEVTMDDVLGVEISHGFCDVKKNGNTSMWWQFALLQHILKTSKCKEFHGNCH